ncbi:hypothetical protein BDD12DRAFT_854921 [Trichophaea hybrida]|nr:hypothetical protein BDD12DRAFT_854921 [Trichophaea hybrida]
MSNTSQPSAAATTRQQAARSSSPVASTPEIITSDSATDATLIHLTPRTSSTQSSTSRTSPPTKEEKRCWICFASDSEEEKPRGDWRAPCKCSLVAHEACLLDWIADMQKTGIETGSNQTPACPQCKTQIRLKEEQSVVLDMIDQAGRIAGRAGAFVAFGGVGSVLFVGCTVYGVNTIYTICGPEYANEILLGRDSEFQWTWRLGVGLPLIPFVLIASRTRIFDSILPVLPVIFFCHTDPLHFTLPPSPQITLALLPYIRSFYNTIWQHYIASYEAQWIKETTPKFAIENAEAQAQQRQRQANANGGRRQRNRRGQEAAPGIVEAEIEVQQEWDGEVILENHNLILQGSNVTSMILGALLWPSVAKMIGQSLGRLPTSWGGDKVRKWLPTQLARNVAGGLMVVVLKDFISLYCKYKRAQRFRSRSVMNYIETKPAKKQRSTTGVSSRVGNR